MTLDDTRRGDHADLAAAQLADRLAIRILIDADASFADPLDAEIFRSRFEPKAERFKLAG